ncbi:hypothetical protein Tco_0008918 [Tanacetum coccineum]
MSGAWNRKRLSRLSRSGVRGMILAAQSEAFKQENGITEKLHGLDQQMERKEDKSLYFMNRIWVPLVGGVRTIIIDEAHKTRYFVHPGADKMYHDLRDMYWDAIGYEYSYHPQTDGQSEHAIQTLEDMLRARKLLEFEVGDRVLLKVSAWKGMIRFGTKGKLAPRYVGPFEILKRIGPVAYRLRLPKELGSVHDTFHVSNLKKCLANANPHIPLDEIKIDKTLRFVEEPVEIMDCEVRRLKRSKILLAKVHRNSKCGPKFTWEREDHMKSKYPQLYVDHDVEPAS